MYNPFQQRKRDEIKRVVIASSVFHAVVLVLAVLWYVLRPEPEVIKVPVFDMIQMPQAKPQPKPKPKPRPRTQPEPKPQEDLEPRPVEKKEPDKPKEEPKPKEEKPKEVVKNEPDSVPEMEMPDLPPVESNMPMPEFSDASPLQTVESIYVDPLLQVYFERLIKILMGNFKPPDGLDIARGSSTRVHFVISRNGKISSIRLKNSSGNGTWDRLSLRAVQISRLPPLPPNYRAPVLPLIFDFKEK